MSTHSRAAGLWDPCVRGAGPQSFYRRVMQLIGDAGIRYLIGGTHALKQVTQLPYDPRDFDILIHRSDLPYVQRALERAGYPFVVAHPHFVAKVYDGDQFVDLIFGSGNGLTDIDDEWFAQGIWGTMFDIPVQFCAAEDLLWSKAFIMERERYDGADVAHLILACGHRLDWVRLVSRFGAQWRVLLAHLTLFGFAYPGRREIVPPWVMDYLLEQLTLERSAPEASEACHGTFVSRRQYLIDLRHLGMDDARLAPDGPLSREEIDHWTAAAEAEV